MHIAHRLVLSARCSEDLTSAIGDAAVTRIWVLFFIESAELNVSVFGALQEIEDDLKMMRRRRNSSPGIGLISVLKR